MEYVGLLLAVRARVGYRMISASGSVEEVTQVRRREGSLPGTSRG